MNGPANMDNIPAARFLRQFGTLFAAETDALNALDRPVGDGDHGSTMARGAAAAARCAKDAAETDTLMQAAGLAFRQASGGASGALFAEIPLAIGRAVDAGSALHARHLVDGIAGAVTRIQRLGRARPGDKTMLDALVPALERGEAALEGGGTLADVVAAMRDGATAGAESTIEMAARAGRGRFVPDGGRGHMDPARGRWC